MQFYEFIKHKMNFLVVKTHFTYVNKINKQVFLIYLFQHANEDVEKMILGNKCDMEDKRVVSKDRGEGVSV